ncbi:hypothetical protein [Homoserinibacter gongjuensis]|uniref:hypothetical protein n=1 Tax=Homoserinibacter gongjuensis TaxID=1162968 RepID=UPI0024E0BC1C|nr:hypothetical protein [Homoserinibacter gongjuensis]
MSRTASAALQIGPLNVRVTPGKTITPGEVPAGGEFSVALAARNASNGPLTSLVIEEPGSGAFLSEELTFAGFTGWTWPSGATAGTVVWHFASASDQTDPISATGAPTAPTPASGDWITGFTLSYTGEIAEGTTAGATFTVQTDPGMIADAAPFYEDVANVVGVTGTNPAGTDTETASDDVRIYFPEVALELEKTVRPALVTPGARCSPSSRRRPRPSRRASRRPASSSRTPGTPRMTPPPSGTPSARARSRSWTSPRVPR